LISVDDAEQLARFMQYVDGNIAREVGALVGWSGTFWARRYTAIVVSDEEAAQVERLRYILAHGVKESLVEKVLDWPGVHAARSILKDEPLTGYWFDRTQEYAARNRGEEYRRLTLCHGGDVRPHAPALLGAPVRRGVSKAGRSVGGGDRA
jgi:hypothetical protein